MRYLTAFSAVAVLAAIAVTGHAQAPTPPPGPGLDIMMTRCTGCHPITQVINAPPKTAQAWAQTVRAMAERGGEMTPEEIATVNAYLAEHYAVPVTATAGAQATATPSSPAPVANH